VGGRARSGILRKDEFPSCEVTVLDILADEGVDVVADAHEMSRHLPPESFDAVLCVSVFEHLVMPWKVAVEMNRVMKPGAIGYISTHQTIGMHDLPWDYYRFSDTAWNGLFGPRTGFRILGTALDHPLFIVPFHYTEFYAHAESSAGFETSAVLVEKISPSLLDWDAAARDVVEDAYPDTPDGNDPELVRRIKG
jgi:hypothetical protein